MRVAVGAVVFRDDGAVLLVLRGRPPLEGAWSLPGGKVEAGESLAEAVRREVLEETGLLVVPGPCVAVVTLSGEGYVYEVHEILCDLAPGVHAESLRAGDDARAVRFWAESELASAGATAAVLTVIDKARGVRRRGASATAG